MNSEITCPVCSEVIDLKKFREGEKYTCGTCNSEFKVKEVNGELIKELVKRREDIKRN